MGRRLILLQLRRRPVRWIRWCTANLGESFSLLPIDSLEWSRPERADLTIADFWSCRDASTLTCCRARQRTARTHLLGVKGGW